MSCTCGCCGNLSGCEFDGTGLPCSQWLCAGGLGASTQCDPSVTPTQTLEDLTNVWTEQNCPTVFGNVLSDDQGLDQITCNTLKTTQTQVNNLMNTYVSLGGDFTDSLGGSLIEFCGDSQQYPGVCDLFLSQYCSKFTRDQISTSEKLNSLCGCYAPSDVSLNLTNKACDPICHLLGVTQKPDPTTAGKTDTCSNTVCVIDDVNINLINSSVTNGEEVFKQICPPANDADRTCIISGANIVDTMKASGIGPTYENYCGASVVCYNESQVVTCPPAAEFKEQSTDSSFPLIFLIIIVFIVIIAIVIMVASRHTVENVEVDQYY